MNILSIVSFIMAFGVLAFGLLSASDDVSVFIDWVSAFIVLGGTIAATAISFRIERLLELVKVFIMRIIKGKQTYYQEVIEVLMKVADAYRKSPEEALKFTDKVSDPFLKEALSIGFDGFLTPRECVKILRSRVENMYQHYLIDANKFKSIGKFPPAFGMMGTTIGMIVLLSNLGGADAAKTIGPSMAICLITTLYGVAIANLVIIPIAENLTANAKEIKLKNTIIVEGIKLVLENKNPVVLAEELNSFLLPHDRLDWKEVVGKA